MMLRLFSLIFLILQPAVCLPEISCEIAKAGKWNSTQVFTIEGECQLKVLSPELTSTMPVAVYGEGEVQEVEADENQGSTRPVNSLGGLNIETGELHIYLEKGELVELLKNEFDWNLDEDFKLTSLGGRVKCRNQELSLVLTVNNSLHLIRIATDGELDVVDHLQLEVDKLPLDQGMIHHFFYR